MSTDNGTTSRMKGGVRRPRTAGQSWTYVVDMGLQPAQRCEDCGRREWVGAGASRPARSVAGSSGRRRSGARSRRAATTQSGTRSSPGRTRSHGSAAATTGRRNAHAGDVPAGRVAARDRRRRAQEPRRSRPTSATSRTSLIGPSSQPFTLGTMQLSRAHAAGDPRHYELLAEGYTADVARKTARREIVARKGLSARRSGGCTRCCTGRSSVAVDKHRLHRSQPGQGRRPQAAGAPSPSRERIVHFWEPAELQRFLTFVHELDRRARGRTTRCGTCSLTPGMRRGEVLGAQVGGRRRGATLTVRRNRVPLKGGVVEETTTKTKRQRTIDLDPGTVKVLKRQRESAEARRVSGRPALAGGVATSSPTRAAMPLDPGVVSWQFRVAVAARQRGRRRTPKTPKATKLSPLSVHGLRHTHATIALQAGIPVTVVSKRLGHASVTMTLNVYAHCLKGAQADLAATFASVVRRGAF